MSLFGVLFVIVGVLFLASPILPGNNIEDRVDKTSAIVVGIFFIFHGFADTFGVENHPLSILVMAVLAVIGIALFGYSLYDDKFTKSTGPEDP